MILARSDQRLGLCDNLLLGRLEIERGFSFGGVWRGEILGVCER